ncbi:MAG: DUF2207 family protein [Oscillospiraceae bacterium]
MLMLPLFSLNAWAEDYSAELNSLHFDIELYGDGSAFITETREVVFTGDHEFTRYGVNNIFTGPRVFTDWQVSIDGTSAPQLDEPDNENRPENTFAVEDTDEGNTVYIYFRQQSSGTRTFQISYWVENAVKLYSDVGEFFWNLTAKSGISDIGTLTATLTAPDGVPIEEFRIWAHGPLNGTFEKQPDGSAFLQVDNVSVGTIVDIRSTMPAYCFFGGWEQEGEALDGILAEEQELADSANAKREEEERRRAEQDAYWAEREAWEAEHPVLYSIEQFLYSIEQFCQTVCDSVYYFLEEHGILLIVIILLSLPILTITGVFSLIAHIVHKIKMKMFRKRPTQSPRYYRELPDDRSAPVVDRLIHFYDGKSNISRQISAAMLELDLKKLLNFSTAAGDTTILLNEQLGEELFPRTSQDNAETASEHTPSYQETLWDFLCNAADGSGRISIKDLKKYINDNRDEALNFRSSFSGAVEREYTERVKTEDEDTHSSKGFKPYLIIAAAAGILAMLICMLAMLYDGIRIAPSLLVGIITFVAVLIILAIIRWAILFVNELSAYHVLDQQSEDDLALWQAFGRFLDDFTTFEDKELPEFPVWRKYMVYAVAMGHGKKLAKALALKYPEAMSAGNNDAYNDDMYYFMQDMALYDAMDSIGREVAEVRASGSSDSGSRSDDVSWSDGDGGGGGFSDSGGGSDSGSGGDFID